MAEVITGWKSAATRAGKSVTTLRRMVEAGQLQAAQDEEGRWTFRAADLEALRGGGAGQSGGGGGPGPEAVPGGAASPLASELELELYRALDQGEPLPQAVLRLGVDPTWAHRRAVAFSKLEQGSRSQLADEVGHLRAKVVALEEEVALTRDEYAALALSLQTMSVLIQASTR